MPRADFQSVVLSNFGGPTRNALAARNIRYFFQENGDAGYPTCKIGTREGHEPIFNPADTVRTMYNFLATWPPLPNRFINWVVYFTGTELKRYLVDTGGILQFSPPLAITAFKVSIAQAGIRCYVAFYDDQGLGTSVGYVIASAGYADRLFQPPLTTSEVTLTPSETTPTDGVVTPGLHKLGIILTTRTGYTGKPGPVAGDLFTPTEFTVVAEGDRIDLMVTGTWPTSAESIAIIMTTTTNQSKYFFVPGAIAAVPGGVPFAVAITINISDPDLEQSDPADQYFNLFIGPLSPSFVCAYNRRMVYGAGDRVYISDNDDFQAITEDQHVIIIPGFKNIRTAAPYHDGNLHLIGDNWTYSVADNGDVPGTWAGPQLVDGSIGTIAVNGVTRDPSQGVELMATAGGLRIFDGQFGPIPLTFWVPDWARINWAGAPSIEILDDIENQCIRVLVPLDEATTPSHEMVFDYKSGKTPETIRYSLNSVPGRFCFALVQENTSRRRAVWLGPTAVGEVWRRDKALRSDDGTSIADQVYETQMIVPLKSLGGPLSFHGAHFSGNGTSMLRLTAYTTKHERSAPPKDTDLSLVPSGKRVLRQWLLNGENESLEFSTQAGWFELLEVEPYFSQWIRQR